MKKSTIIFCTMVLLMTTVVSACSSGAYHAKSDKSKCRKKATL
ncbi:MAG: hypothetical protein ACK40G_08465 [Cytophagaceae bacterium]